MKATVVDQSFFSQTGRTTRDKATDVMILEKYLSRGITNIVSVPCSVTDTWQSLAADLSRRNQLNMVMSNHEGNLVGIATGIYFGTGRPALIHMQNTGLFNAADGFVSFANKNIYNIPMAVMVTYRGATDKDDSEPHQEMGSRTDSLIELIFENTATVTGSRDGNHILAEIDRAIDKALSGGIGVTKLSPLAFDKTRPPAIPPTRKCLELNCYDTHYETKGDASKPPLLDYKSPITRDEAIQAILKTHSNAAVLFSNGYNARAGQTIGDRPGNFYNVGYMGGTLAIGWGLANSNPEVDVVVIDGDQNSQMSSMKDHLSEVYPSNLYWYILNNHIGASVGTAESIPLAPQYKYLARIIETIPDEPYSFKYPRVKGDANAPNNGLYTLEQISRNFRSWIKEQR